MTTAQIAESMYARIAELQNEIVRLDAALTALDGAATVDAELDEAAGASVEAKPARPRKPRARKTPTGGKSKRTKLTQDIADQIRAADSSQSQIARDFGVSRATVHNIKSGKQWPAQG